MNDFRIPPSPTWYTQAVCTPNNGLLYIAGNHTTIAYIPPLQSARDSVAPQSQSGGVNDGDASNIKIIQSYQHHFKSVVCDPNWTTSKWFVTLNEVNAVLVWNLETEKVCRGHRAHHQSGTSNDHQPHHHHYNGKAIDSSSAGGAMCITKNRQVLSIDRNAFVKYCLASNTYSVFGDHFIPKRNTVCALKASPYDDSTIAIGYRNGLIMIANIADSTILQKLRGHDTDIVSLEWMLITTPTITSDDQLSEPANANQLSKPTDTKFETTEKLKPSRQLEQQNVVEPISKLEENPPVQHNYHNQITVAGTSKSTEKRQKEQSTPREPPKPIVDAGDMFDIHSYDYLEEEFGTISRPNRGAPQSDGPIGEKEFVAERKPSINNENFNFVEACQSLRDQIRGDNASDSEDNTLIESGKTAVNMIDIQNMIEKNGDGGGGNESIELPDDDDESDKNDDREAVEKSSTRSTMGSSHDCSEFAELENELSALQIDENEERLHGGKIFLASGAQESFVVIWDVENGTVCDKMQLKVQHHGKMSIPKPNCAIAWYRQKELIVNSANGKILRWTIIIDDNGHIKSSVEEKDEFSDLAVIGICSNVEFAPANPIVWTFSIHLNVVGRQFRDGSSEIIANFCTLPIGMYVIRECPHDPNKIAIAGNNKRISILDLTTLAANNVQIQSLIAKIQARVLALAWHPTNENLLSFSTNEGRVGVFNINKASSAPELVKNFNGKDVYRISYGQCLDGSAKYVLYACNDRKLMIFPENFSAKTSSDYKSIQFPASVTAVSGNAKYLAVGLTNGVLKIFTKNGLEKKEIYSESLSKKYLSEASWCPLNEQKLAVSSSEDKIYIIEGSSSSDGNTTRFERISELAGHQSSVTWVKWSNHTEHKLVSAGFDNTVRVWNAQTRECIAWSLYENRMYCAIFMPNDENFVLCSGQSETMHIFDVRNRLTEHIGSFDAKKKKKNLVGETQWATQHQQDVQKLRAQEKKKLRKLEKKVQSDDVVDIIADGLSTVSLQAASPLKLSHITILYLTSKELNKEPLNCLEKLLCKKSSETSDAESDQPNEILHQKLFGNREMVQQLLDDELKNHKSSNTVSIGNLLIPQINYELKAGIIESIIAKRLTEQQIALSPSISYEFWKNCCTAYANQCIEQGLTLQATPYLLATHQITDCIEKLCEAHFYREAWAIAKMYKEPEDEMIFESIATKWIKHLEQMGNLEGAALIAFLADKLQTALDVFNKRKSQTPQIEKIIQSIKERIQAEKIVEDEEESIDEM